MSTTKVIVSPHVAEAEKRRQEIQAEIDAKIAELKALKKPANIRLGISEKGCLSVYGLQKFPISLYKNQWHTLLAHVHQIEDFLTENASLLREK